MAKKLQIEGPNDTLLLSQQGVDGMGFEAQPGVTGLGLPPVTVQWSQGAGDGAKYRGMRVNQRVIDVPLYLSVPGDDAASQALLNVYMSRLAMILADQATLRLIEDDGSQWTCPVVRTGGGDYSFGVDTKGVNDLLTVITFTSGDPYWTAEESQVFSTEIQRVDFLGNFGKMAISHVVQLRDVQLENTGDAPAYPVWTVVGPGNTFVAENDRGEKFQWNGTLGIGETLTVDTQTGIVIDNANTNRYGDMAAGPVLWRVPPGTTVATASLQGTDNGSLVKVEFKPRKWLVI